MSNARPPIGTEVPSTSSARRRRSISNRLDREATTSAIVDLCLHRLMDGCPLWQTTGNRAISGALRGSSYPAMLLISE